ncbi:MAG: SDR family oxidoreductase [Ilumatobacteraceae bacterium]
MIAESLAGKRIAITGSTGSWALRSSSVSCQRPRLRTRPARPRRQTHQAAKSVEKELLRNDAFDRLREQYNGPDSTESFAEMTARRITTITGDVSNDGSRLNDDDRRIFSTADVVIHSAATVSFDSPLDRAVEISLLGPVRIAQLCHDLGVSPHLVAVSTCYVAGNRRGRAPEVLVSDGPFDIGLSWKAEDHRSSSAPQRQRRAQPSARSPRTVPQEPRRTRRRRHLALAAKTEQIRGRWVRDQLVEGGPLRRRQRRLARTRTPSPRRSANRR